MAIPVGMIRWLMVGVMVACLAPVWAVGHVTGTVYFLRGGGRVPVAGARVCVGAAATTSDAAGRFALDAPDGAQTVVVTHPHFHDPLTLPVAVVDDATTEVDAHLGQVYYLFVGINAYTDSHLPHLRSAVRDARSMRAALTASFWGDDVTLLDRQATKACIGDAVTRLIAAMTPADYFVFYYSGHGGTALGPGDGTHYDFLQPVDSDANHPERDLYDTEVAAWLACLPAPTHAVLILDSCHAGGFLRGTPVAGEVWKRGGDAPLPSIGCTLLAATGAHEYSIDDERGGFFTRRLVQGLTHAHAQADVDHNRDLTASELLDYTASAVTRAAKAVHETQHPCLLPGSNPALLRY